MLLLKLLMLEISLFMAAIGTRKIWHYHTSKHYWQPFQTYMNTAWHIVLTLADDYEFAGGHEPQSSASSRLTRFGPLTCALAISCAPSSPAAAALR